MAPQAGACLPDARPSLRVEYSDTGSGVDPESLRIRLGDIDLPHQCTAEPDSATCTLGQPLEEGEQRLAVSIADHAGNRSAPVTVAIHIDTIAPRIDLDPAEPTRFGPDAEVTGTLSEAAALTHDGQTVEVDKTTLAFAIPLSLDFGTTDIALAAEDCAGNLGEARLTLTRLRSPPQFTTQAPTTVEAGRGYTYTAQATDPDPDDTLSYALVTGPAGMNLDADTGQITWPTDEDDIGEHPVELTVTDGNGDTDTQAFTITVGAANGAPVANPQSLQTPFETPIALVLSGADPEGDALSYRVVSPAAHGQLSGEAPHLVYTPEGGFTGTDSFDFVVSDGELESAPATVTIEVGRNNSPPEIVSPPVQQVSEGALYGYDVRAVDPDSDDVLTYSLRDAPAGMTIDSQSGEIQWPPTPELVGPNLADNPMCMAVRGSTAGVIPAADVVVVVDESGSMAGEHAWIADVTAPLEAHLVSNGIGEGALPNRYGLIGFERVPRPVPVGNEPIGSYLELIDATKQLRISGGFEDGWLGIRHALVAYPLREKSARNIILITDEDRDNGDGSITYDSILADLREHKAVLNAVVNTPFRCGDDSPALGLGQDGIGYKADGRGGFVTCSDAYAYKPQSFGTSIQDYVDLALASGGAAWDLNILRDGGIGAQSFTNALITIKVREILEQIPPQSQADLVVRDLRAFNGLVQVDVGNRGMVDVDQPLSVELWADNTRVGTQSIVSLAAGARETANFAWSPSGVDPQRLTASITVLSDSAECHENNNRLQAAWVRVRATDTGDLFDEQGFSVTVSDQNAPPTIVSEPVTDAVIGSRYRYRVLASDPDRGDGLEFYVASGPPGLGIDRVSGEILYVPDAGQEGEHPVRVGVRDLAGLEAVQSYTLRVGRTYQPPRFTSSPDRRAVYGTVYQYQATAEGDPQATLSFDVFLAPQGLTIDAQSGLVSWSVPADFFKQTHYVILRVRDQFGNYDLQFYTLIGDSPNVAPQITSAPTTVATEGGNYAYNPRASDANFMEEFGW